MEGATLQLLGGFELRASGREPLPPVARKPKALLAMLALSGGRPLPREQLALLLWGDVSGEEGARHSLRQALSLLRRSLPEHALRADRDQVSLDAGALQVDAVRFEALAGSARPEDRRDAAALYRGDLLDGFAAQTEAFEAWVQPKRQQLRERATLLLHATIVDRQASGDGEGAIMAAMRLIAMEPLREEAHRELMRLLFEQGRRAEALAVHERLRELLARELSVQPDARTQALAREIRERPWPAPPAGTQSPRPELRHVVVLQAGLHAPADPEETSGQLGRFDAAATAAVQEHGGRVERRLPDAVVALFGVDRARGTEGERALATAVALRERLAREGIAVAQGLAAGLVLVAGDAVTGDALGQAARLQARAAAAEIRISSGVRALLGVRVEAEPVEDGLRFGALRHQPRFRGPLVGRRAELAVLEQAVDLCAQGEGRIVLLRGDAGLGKTRLLDRACELAVARGVRVHRTLVLDFASPGGHDAVRELARSIEVDGTRGDDPSWRACLADLVGGSWTRELRATWEAMSPDLRRSGRRNVLASLARSAAAAGPVLVAVDDMHWADTSTLDDLSVLLPLSAEAPMLLVLATRRDEEPPAIQRALRGRAVTTLDVSPLSPRESSELARSHSTDAARVALCVERAHGNPLFLEQLLEQEVAGGDVPASVQAIVAARLDALPAPDREGLQAASVLGPRVPAAAMLALLGRAFDPALLVDRGLLVPDGEALAFSHALVRDAVYASILPSRRRELHRCAAAWAEPTDPALRALHLDRAGDPDAGSAYLAAAREALAEEHVEEALRCAARGLQLHVDASGRNELLRVRAEACLELGRMDEARAGFEEALRVAPDEGSAARSLLGIAGVDRVTDRIEDGLAALDRAAPLVRGDEDRSRLHWLRGNLLFPIGQHGVGLAEQELALVHARRVGSPLLEARAVTGIGDAHYAAGRIGAAAEAFVRALGLAREHGLGKLVLTSLKMLGVTRAFRLELAACAANCQEAARTAASLDAPREEIVARTALAVPLSLMGRHGESEAEARRTLEVAGRLGARRFEALALAALAEAHWRQGRAAEAERTARSAYEAARASAPQFSGPLTLGVLALVAADPAVRRAALQEGESLVRDGAISHAVLRFHAHAIDATLAMDDEAAVLAHAAALEAYGRAEALPWCTFFAGRARALVAVRRGARGPEIREELTALIARAREAQAQTPLVALEQALEVVLPG